MPLRYDRRGNCSGCAWTVADESIRQCKDQWLKALNNSNLNSRFLKRFTKARVIETSLPMRCQVIHENLMLLCLTAGAPTSQAADEMGVQAASKCNANPAVGLFQRMLGVDTMSGSSKQIRCRGDVGRVERRSSRAKIRSIMSPLYSHAIRWKWTDKNPLTQVRQSAERSKISDRLVSG